MGTVKKALQSAMKLIFNTPRLTPEENLEPEEEEAEDSEEKTPEPESTVVLTDPNDPTPVWSLWSGASYACIMLLIGLPLWWRTTTIERVQLSYYEMLNLHEQFHQDKFVVPLNIALKGFSATEQLSSPDKGLWKYFIEPLEDQEKQIIESTHSLEEIDFKLCNMLDQKNNNTNNIHFTILHIQNSNILNKYGENIVLGNCRNIFYVSKSSHLNEENLHPSLTKLVDFIKSDEDLPLAVSYNLLFTLIVPEPELFDARWDIENGVNDYIHPMLQKLKSFSSFVTRAQTIFYHKLNLKPTLDNGVYKIPYEQLPLVINPVESKLSSFVSENPMFNFLVYVSPCDVSPLQIFDENGVSLHTNSFYVPQWGGIQIYNSQCNKTQNGAAVTHEVQITQVMSIIISQFRDLIGVPRSDENLKVLDFHGSALRDWEVDLIIRKRLEKLLQTSSNTLKSLGTLLGQITNIVVTEEVGNEVEISVNSLKLSFDSAMSGNITEAQSFAQTSFKSSEVAFHHPSNLAQLYFPDDQKYAIYIPLYLPVGIPVLLSLRVIVKNLIMLWRKRKEKVE